GAVVRAIGSGHRVHSKSPGVDSGSGTTMDTFDGLILFSHGSVLCGAAETLREHAQRLADSGRWRRVEVGFLNYSEPRFAEAVRACARAAVRRIVVAPYFLIPGV